MRVAFPQAAAEAVSRSVSLDALLLKPAPRKPKAPKVRLSFPFGLRLTL